MVAFSLGLAGCVSLRLPTKSASQIPVFQVISPKVRAHRLSKLTSWDINGALSLQMRNQTSLANYQWQQQGPKHYHLQLSSSLNLYVLSINGTPGSVKLNSNDNKVISGTNAADLVAQTIGYPLPVHDLYYWIRSLPAPGEAYTHYDHFGHLTQLRQGQWQVQFSHFITTAAGDLPQMLDIHSPELTLRIVIKNWMQKT